MQNNLKKNNCILHISLIYVAVYKEVENQINDFRDMLKQKLMELPNTLDNQIKLIR
jgi:hypothetical protein